jgi:hypothetical protein
MSTMKSKWRRIACSVILALFTGSVLGTVCVSPSGPHPGPAQGWTTIASEPADAPHGDEAARGSAADDPAPPVHGSSPAHTIASCDPPAYAGTMVASEIIKRFSDAAHPQLDAMASGAIGRVWSVSPEIVLTRQSPVRPSARPPDVLTLFSHLRI